MQNQAQSEIEDDVYESPLLDTLRNTNISNFIIHEACKKYYETYKSKWIPLSFIEFYFEEFKIYDFLSNEYLKPYFEIYQTIDTVSLVDHYYTTQYSLIIGKRNINKQLHFLLKKSDYLWVELQNESVLGLFDPPLYKELGKVDKHMDENDEIVDIKEKYEYYMLKRLVLDADRKKEFKKTQEKAIEEIKSDPSNVLLVGTQTEVPKQTGKVSKIFFPKLSLPSPYPILTDKSRINSEHRAKSFTRTDKQIDIINNYRFNGVKYKLAFIEKRKKAKKPPKRKFDFDF